MHDFSLLKKQRTLLLCVVVIRRNNNANLSTHPGFSEQFCYGDVTLRLHFLSDSVLSRDDRDKFVKQYADGRTDDGARIPVKPPTDALNDKPAAARLALLMSE